MSINYFGYFTESNQTEPAYDPMNTVPCIVCIKPWTEQNVCTISLLKVGDNRSYFYRAHKACYKTLSPEEQSKYDSSIIDNI